MANFNWMRIPQDFYNNLIYPLIVSVEETGDPSLVPYNDAKNNLGYITIGSGFNLTDSSIFNAVVNKIFYPVLDDIMAERTNDNWHCVSACDGCPHKYAA